MQSAFFLSSGQSVIIANHFYANAQGKRDYL